MKRSITISLLAVLTFAGCESENAAVSVSETSGSAINLHTGQIDRGPRQPEETSPAAGNVLDDLIAAIEHADELPHEEISPATGGVDAVDLTDEDDYVQPEVGSWSIEISRAEETGPETCESILERLKI